MKSALFSIFILLSTSQVQADEYVKIVGDNVDIRSGPGEHHTVIVAAQKGVLFKGKGTRGDWQLISMFSGEDRYVYAALTTKVNVTLELPGLTLRKSLFKKLRRIEDTNAEKTEARYPSMTTNRTNKRRGGEDFMLDIMTQVHYEKIRDDKAKLELFQAVNVAPPLYDQIAVEGLEKEWWKE